MFEEAYVSDCSHGDTETQGCQRVALCVCSVRSDLGVSVSSAAKPVAAMQRDTAKTGC